MTSDSAQTPYEKIGGEQKLREIVHCFYEVMDAWPEAQGIRQMHQQELFDAEQKLFEFMSGWLGGPRLFEEKYGHPRLRARHMPFSIGKSERDQWVLCMVQAFDKAQVEEPIRSELLHSLLRLADHMRNKEEE